jgi:glucokinase
LQTDLLRFVERRHDHVSWERVLSGPGLVANYEFLRDRASGEEPAWLGEALRGSDPAAAISQAALDGRSTVCGLALDLFVDLLGSEAGNLALKFNAIGGFYIGGGIAPRILPRLQDGRFLAAFLSKGRMRALLETVPVRVILDTRLALAGAARYASGTGPALRAPR